MFPSKCKAVHPDSIFHASYPNLAGTTRTHAALHVSRGSISQCYCHYKHEHLQEYLHHLHVHHFLMFSITCPLPIVPSRSCEILAIMNEVRRTIRSKRILSVVSTADNADWNGPIHVGSNTPRAPFNGEKWQLRRGSAQTRYSGL